MAKIIGIDIGGTNTAIVTGNNKGKIFNKYIFKTDTAQGPQYALNKIFKKIEKIQAAEKNSNKYFSAIGISCGGPLNTKKGIIKSPPNLPGWDNIPIVAELEERFAINTFIENDANASALAEKKFGAGKKFENFIFLTFGTGMGAGIIINGEIYRGANDLAGEVGHIRLKNFGPEGYNKKGSFEGFCSGGGLVNLARLISSQKKELGLNHKINNKELKNLTAKDIGAAAEDDDPLAREILAYSGKYLGYGLAILVDIFNPEAIIIGSIYHRCQEFLEPAARKFLEKEALSESYNNCQIIPSKLKDQIGDYAALSVAINNQ